MTPRRAARCWGGALAALALSVVFSASLFAQTPNLPPKPTRYITDQAGVIDASTLDSVNSQLEQFEKDTSNQFVVAIYPSLPDNTEIAPYAVELYNAWHLGQAGRDNGVILLVAVNDHKMTIGTNRGLNGALTDALCNRIIDQVIAPRFKQNDYSGGVQAGVNAIIAATKGEFKGDGTTADQHKDQGVPWVAIIIFIIIFIILSRYGSSFNSGPVIYSSGGWGGGGYGGGGGFSGGGGGGGFTGGGGGNSDGGGASGGW
jgi:uncharacterized protein